MTFQSFASDNHSGIHPKVLEAIQAVNTGQAKAYGEDDTTEAATRLFKEQFGPQSEAYFVLNGTAANVLGISAVVRSHHAILCAETAHLHIDECSAPEKFMGTKLILIPTYDGKIHPEQISQYFTKLGDPHQCQPGVVSITQATEYGTIYSPDEVKAIAAESHHHGLLLHMDGARIANAAAGMNCSLNEISLGSGVDILSFGGTKNGLMCGEAVVFANPAHAREFQYIRKQGMQLASKMRFISAQFEALLKNELWHFNASHANRMAQRLADVLRKFPQIEITQPVQANAVFAKIPPELIARLHETFYFYVWNEKTSEVRLMTSFDTTQTMVDEFEKVLESALTRV